MKSYRRNYLPESDFRRTLGENPWVLSAWENEIVALIDEIPGTAMRTSWSSACCPTRVLRGRKVRRCVAGCATCRTG